MKRDDLLLRWFAEHTPFEVSWLDIGAGDGSVSRIMKEIRPLGSYSCWDVAPKHPKVMSMRGDGVPPVRSDYILFNFVLHHVGDEAMVNKYLLEAINLCNMGVIIQEDINDHRPTTWEKLKGHDPKGFFLTLQKWQEKLIRLCPAGNLSTYVHPEPASDTFGYHVPRALFVLQKKPADKIQHLLERTVR